MNLDRFSNGLDDQQEALVLAYCSGCGGEIYPGELVCQPDPGELLHWEGTCLLVYFRSLTVWSEEIIGTRKKSKTYTRQGNGKNSQKE